MAKKTISFFIRRTFDYVLFLLYNNSTLSLEVTSAAHYMNSLACIHVTPHLCTTDFLRLIFYACLRLRFLDVETSPGPRRPVPGVCRILRSNVRGLAGNLSDLTVVSSQYHLLFCSETLVSDMRHVSEVLVPGCIKQTFETRRWGRGGETGSPAYFDGIAICRSSKS